MSYTKEDFNAELSGLVNKEVNKFMIELAKMKLDGEVSSSAAKTIFQEYTKGSMWQAFAHKEKFLAMFELKS